MKGVIVQVGKPKSIVLYNNGKLGAIPTPADCHVGMVITVKLNNNLKIIAIGLAVLLLGITVFFEVYESISSASDTGDSVVFTVEQVKILPDDTWVMMTGTIVRFLGDEMYIFRDDTGDITVDIDRKFRQDFSVGDAVEITGKIDIDKSVVLINVKNIKKLITP
jgi:uncharacterized protein (TIGR00156 family)